MVREENPKRIFKTIDQRDRFGALWERKRSSLVDPFGWKGSRDRLLFSDPEWLSVGLPLDDDLHPPIVCAAFGARIVCNRTIFADPMRLNLLGRIAAGNEVGADRLCAQ